MALFALYMNVRSWHEIDTYFVGLILTALFLLAAFNRWKSFLANGSLVGSILGCLYAFALDDTDRYRDKMSYIEAGLFFGFVIGCIARFMKTFSASHSNQEPKELEGKPVGPNSPLFWISALAIAGLSTGLTVAVLFRVTAGEAILATSITTIGGGVFGMGLERIRKQLAWVQATQELLIITALTTGTGAIFGWKILLPILLFDIHLPSFTSEELFYCATYPCTAAGAVIGWIAWAVISSKKRRARTSHAVST